MDIFKLIRQCLTGQDDAFPPHNVDDNEKFVSGSKLASSELAEDELASSILSILFSAEKPGEDLERRLRAQVHTTGWYEGLAKRILDGLIAALNSGASMARAMKEAFEKASAIASKFVEEHPVLTVAVTVVIAIGILVFLLPWAVEALGFGEFGPIEGKSRLGSMPFLFLWNV